MKPVFRRTHRERNTSNEGFSVIITLVLMALVVLLLAATASLIRVETRAAGQLTEQIQARQNAIMGLNVALGKLQRLAGPDRRATAEAGLFGEGADVEAPLSISHPHWVGVFDTTILPDPHDAEAHRQDQPDIDARSKQERFDSVLDWLVSGDPEVVDPMVALDDADSVVLQTSEDPDDSVRVPLVEIDGGNARSPTPMVAWAGSTPARTSVVSRSTSYFTPRISKPTTPCCLTTQF